MKMNIALMIMSNLEERELSLMMQVRMEIVNQAKERATRTLQSDTNLTVKLSDHAILATITTQIGTATSANDSVRLITMREKTEAAAKIAGLK